MHLTKYMSHKQLFLFISREGLISRDEITAYFMRASSIYSKLGLGFAHNFQETTYLRPTFCDNCAGFVSLLFSKLMLTSFGIMPFLSHNCLVSYIEMDLYKTSVKLYRTPDFCLCSLLMYPLLPSWQGQYV